MNIFQIESVTAPVGDTVPMKFIFVNADGTIPDYTNYTVRYILSPYGFENENAYSKIMSRDAEENNVFYVTLTSAETSYIEPGAYTAKIVLEHRGNYYKKARGIFNLVLDTEETKVTV